jgi:hypothetical protein
MELLSQQCAANSYGASNSFATLLLQTIIAAQCSLIPDGFWPKNSGQSIKYRKGKLVSIIS